MAAPLFLALQLVLAEPLPEPPVVIDLIAPVRLLRCPELRPDEIVVCGHRPGEEARLFFRRDPWGRPLKAEQQKRGGIVLPF